MINSINTSDYSYLLYGNSKNNTTFDYTKVVEEANKKAQELLESLRQKNNTAIIPATSKSLKQESAAFLNAYTSSINILDQSAEKLRGKNLDKIMFDKNGVVTDETIKNTVVAFKDTVTKYNSTLKLLNDNADRGSGVMKLLARMAASNPAPDISMAKIGLSVNKDGTLNLNEEKFSSALKTDNAAELKSVKDIISGLNGIADNIHTHALFGSTMSSSQLIGNDVIKAKNLQQENPYYVLYKQLKGNVYGLQDMAYAGFFLDKQV